MNDTKNHMLLSEYMPESELVTTQHLISKPAFPVIDIHAHFGRLVLGDNYDELYDIDDVVNSLKEKGIRNIVNLDGEWGCGLDRMKEKIYPYEDYIINFGTLDISRLDEDDFESYVVKTLNNSKMKGIKGLKFWKNIGLELKDKRGKYITPDDKRLEIVWHTAAELNLPVLFHIADPVAFFKPIDRFNERYEELMANPNWSFCKPGLYSFEQLMEMQEKLVADNPKTTFIIAHFGSYSENLEFVAKYLDRYPNMYIDIAARISELGRQPYSSRKFFIRYQDRILFGTDSTPLYLNSYNIYYRFLETWDEYFDYSDAPIPGQGRWKIYGLGLEKPVLQKIYYLNAEKILFQ